jgi:nitrite reductase (NADH) small subunit/3-phenylpropionate/trans-cinnamate dioxygenase ferredoxin subunit
MSEFRTVCKVQDILQGEGKVVALGPRIIAVFRVDSRFYAVDDVCPHMGASLAGGYVENDSVTCPWHAWRFRLSDGAWADNPRGKVRIGCYEVRVEGDDVQIQLPQPKPPEYPP